MPRSTNNTDVGYAASTRPVKYGPTEGYQPGSGERWSLAPSQPPGIAAATTSTFATLSDHTLSSSPVATSLADSNRPFEGTGQRDMDAPGRVQGSTRGFAPSAPVLIGASGRAVGASYDPTLRSDTTQLDTQEHSPSTPEALLILSAAAARLNGADSPHPRSRRSESSDALASAEYHSLNSPALLTSTSADDVHAMDAPAAADTRQRPPPPPHTSLSNSAWPADMVAGPASPSLSSVPTSAAVASPLAAGDAVARPAAAASFISSPSPAPSTTNARTAAAAAAAAAAARRWTEEEQQRERDTARQTPPRGRGFVLRAGGGGRGDVITQQRGGIGCIAGSKAANASRTPASSPTCDGRGSGRIGVGDDTNHHRSKSPLPLHERRLCYQPFKDTEPVCTAHTASAPDWVLLNVGGRLITTTVATLMADPDSMLASLCACLTRPSPPTPPQQQQQQQQQASARRGGPAGESAHRDATASDPVAFHRRSFDGTAAAAAEVAARPRRETGQERRSDMTLMSGGGGGGDARSLAVDDEDSRGEERREAGEERGVAAAAGTDALGNGSAAAVLAEGAGPTDGDGDHSNRSPAPLVLLAPRRSFIDFQGHSPPQQHQQQQPQSHAQAPSAAAAVSAVRDAIGGATTAAVVVEGEEGDGEAVNPQQAISAVPLDTDRYNAVLLDLDADYFLPVLNYLRHGAVMIPQYLNVDGVLAMAEYLNVAGLVRLLRGPPVPRRVLLFSWGSGSNGELGTHAKRDEATPTMAQVTPFGVRVREIALGANYSCALTDTGNIYTFGNGEWGQLGLGGALTGGRGGGSGTASAVVGGGLNGSNSSNVNGGQDGNGVEVPVELLIPRRIPLFEQIPAVHVAAGYAFAMAVVEGHHVFFWGNNNHGQSGRGRSFFDPHTKKVDTPVLVETLEGRRIIQLSCGSFFALALSEDGALYSWGLVDCVGLGTPEEVERRYHAVLGESLSNERRSVVLTPQLVTVKGRRRAAAGASSSGSSAASERVVRIRAGQWHSGAINEHGELFTWGVGYQGRLGHGSKTPAYVPTLVQGALEGQHVVDVACGSFHTVALTSKGDVFCWGDNASGQCGTTANSPDAFTAPYRVVGLEYVAGGVARSIACGRQHTVVVMEGPQPWCVLPCCQVDACGRPAHSHAQVYCFGEVTRTGNGMAGTAVVGGTTTAAVAGSSGNGPARGSAGGSHGMPLTALSGSALPGSPNYLPFTVGGAATAFLPTPSMAGGRPTLAGTAGHHHPHYQLVTGLQHVDVRAVVSGLHHTFAYVEELMLDDDGRSGDGGWEGGRACVRPPGSSYRSGGGSAAATAHGYKPSYVFPQRPSSAMRPPSSAAAGAIASFYLRGTSSGPMPFYPPDWGLGAEGASSVPPLPPVADASATAASATTRRFYAPS